MFFNSAALNPALIGQNISEGQKNLLGAMSMPTLYQLNQQRLMKSQLDNQVLAAQARYADPMVAQTLNKLGLENQQIVPNAEQARQLQAAQTYHAQTAAQGGLLGNIINALKSGAFNVDSGTGQLKGAPGLAGLMSAPPEPQVYGNESSAPQQMGAGALAGAGPSQMQQLPLDQHQMDRLRQMQGVVDTGSSPSAPSSPAPQLENTAAQLRADNNPEQAAQVEAAAQKANQMASNFDDYSDAGKRYIDAQGIYGSFRAPSDAQRQKAEDLATSATKMHSAFQTLKSPDLASGTLKGLTQQKINQWASFMSGDTTQQQKALNEAANVEPALADLLRAVNLGGKSNQQAQWLMSQLLPKQGESNNAYRARMNYMESFYDRLIDDERKSGTAPPIGAPNTEALGVPQDDKAQAQREVSLLDFPKINSFLGAMSPDDRKQWFSTLTPSQQDAVKWVAKNHKVKQK